MVSLSNVTIGVTSLIWKTQDMGAPLGGVKFSYERRFATLKTDTTGDTPIDEVLTGTDVKITFKIAEPVVGLLYRVLPEGLYTTGSQGSQLGFGADPGFSLRSIAGLLVLHPTDAKGPTDYSKDINLYLAAPAQATLDLNFEVNNQRVYTIEMHAYYDAEYANGRRLGHIGPNLVS